MITYRFEAFDDEANTQTSAEFKTENATWSGYDGPMWKFFDFLKGNGFVFDIHDEPVVMNRKTGDIKETIVL